MDTPMAAPEYLLLFRGTQWDDDLSPEETQRIMEQWTGWVEGLARQGKLKAGQPLKSQGKIVSGANGQTVADGPFAESKEAVGGYILLRVDDMDEALEIARKCPALPYGLTVEVRPVAASCEIQQRVNANLARASA